MTKTTGIILLIFCLVQQNSFGQNDIRCPYAINGAKTVSFTVDSNSFGWKTIEKDFYNPSGLKTRTEFISDSLLTKIDTFIYDKHNRLIKRETLDPTNHKPFQQSTFLYNQNGSNYKILTSAYYIDWVDSINFDTNYFHLRYDFIRDSLERFNERKIYHCSSKAPDFDTSDYRITYQTWLGDSILVIKDNYSGKEEYLKKYYNNCRLVKIVFFDEANQPLDYYQYEYSKFDKKGNWLFKKVYHIKEGQKKLVNTHQREIEFY